MLTVHSLTSHDVPICQLNNLSNLASFCIIFRPRTARRCRIERPAHRKIFFSFLECPKKILDSFLNAKTIESWSLEPQIPVWPTIRLEIRERGRRRRAIRAINECRPRRRHWYKSILQNLEWKEDLQMIRIGNWKKIFPKFCNFDAKKCRARF